MSGGRDRESELGEEECVWGKAVSEQGEESRNLGDAGQGFREVGVCGVEGGVMLVQLLRVCVPHHVPSHCRVTSRHLPVLGSAAEAPGLLSYL